MPWLCADTQGDLLRHLTYHFLTKFRGFDLKISGLILAICFALIARTLVFAQTAPSDTTTLTTNAVFLKNCAKCHGKTATGRHFGGPSLLSEKTAGMSADDLHNIITNGKDRMPKYAEKLTSEQIGTLVQQIKALNKK